MSETQIIEAEISDIREIIRTECWLESERRGRSVHPDDETVRERVVAIILGGAGELLRRKYSLAPASQ
jgi:hypothetical protein